MIGLNIKVRDSITGFEGISVGRAEYLGEKVEILIQPVCLNNILLEAVWFPENRIEAVNQKKKAGF